MNMTACKISKSVFGMLILNSVINLINKPSILILTKFLLMFVTKQQVGRQLGNATLFA